MRRVAVALAAFAAIAVPAHAADAAPPAFRSVSAQFIAALGEPGAHGGTGAQAWGLWRVDPGVRGVDLDRYPVLKADGGRASAGWTFDASDWWLEEHGLIMEKPAFPVPPGRYRVTGGRGVTAVLTVHPADARGAMRWSLDGGATLHDVTHLGCRSARYRPAAGPGSCSPARASQAAFPVAPGGTMPAVEGCTKQDYEVLIVVGVAAGD